MDVLTVLFGLLFLLTILSALLLSLAIFLYRKTLFPDQQALDRARDQSRQIINSAEEKAEGILSEAEIDMLKMQTENSLEGALSEQNSQKLIGEYRQTLERFAASLDSELKNTLGRVEREFVGNINQAESQYGAFLTNLEKTAAEEQGKTLENLSAKINALLFKFEEDLSSFLSSSEQKSVEAINLEIKSARELIDNYKAAQLGIIDENIVSVLERTLSLVLKEKLSLRNQLDLVYEALERAKAEKFFV